MSDRIFIFYRRHPKLAIALAGFFVLCFFYSLFFRAPLNFPRGQMVTIPEGLTVSESADVLKANNIILSKTVFSILLTALTKEKVVAGAYVFEKRISVFSVAYRVAVGDYNVHLTKLFYPEGMTIREMARVCNLTLPDCKEEEFIQRAKGKEGYLFPDTYFFLPTAKAEEVIQTLSGTFQTKIVPLEGMIEAFGKPLPQVITMASILEAEARKFEDRQMISGILWKRIQIGMPLQVDAPFEYFSNKNTFTLTTADLRLDSPYNTYTRKGLPPTPIGNPGLEAIQAAVTPIESPYLFYLSDKSGTFHYAVTHDQHVKNKARYLK